MNGSLYLALAIFTEVIGTSALRASAGMTRLWPTVLVVVAYVANTYFLAVALKTIPIGILYAIWSGVGIIAITLIGWLYFHQKLDAPAVCGVSLIMAGVLVINLFSETKTLPE